METCVYVGFNETYDEVVWKGCFIHVEGEKGLEVGDVGADAFWEHIVHLVIVCGEFIKRDSPFRHLVQHINQRIKWVVARILINDMLGNLGEPKGVSDVV